MKHLKFFIALSMVCVLFSFSACSDSDSDEPSLPVLGGSQENDSIRSVTSRNKPKSGQTHRSSDNFSTKNMVSATHILWSCPEGVSFKVQIDKKGTDGTYADRLQNGSITEIGSAKDTDRLYISDPKGSSEEYFTISYTMINKDEENTYVSSAADKMPGQDHRASANFVLRHGVYKVECPAAAKFEIWEDVSGGSDHHLLSEVRNGTYLNGSTADKLYIANSQGMDHSYGITFKRVVTPWMNTLSDNVPLYSLTIPGTHDAATGTVGEGISKCQNFEIPVQLEAGIRMFDIRVNESMHLCHNTTDCHTTFKECIKYFTDFLDEFSSETIIMLLSPHGDNAPEKVTNFFKDEIDPSYFLMKSTVPTIGEARGKIVVMRRFDWTSTNSNIGEGGIDLTDWPSDGVGEYTVKGNHYMIEDRYYSSSEAIHDTKEKERLMKDMFDKANSDDSKYKDCLFITYASVAGRGTHTPWDYAWGGGPILEVDPEMSTAVHDYLSGIIDGSRHHKAHVKLGIVMLDFYNKHGHDDPYHNVENLINLNCIEDAYIMPYPKTN